MATQTRPFLMTGAALATAAAIVAASPGLAPSASIASPNALSTAAYELTTFADVFTIPTDVWTNLLFSTTDYGGFVGPENTPLAVEPWATYCSYECTISGFSGALYLGLDALVNGNGNGWDDRENWNVGIVNYLFEPTFARPVGGGGANFTIQTGTAGLSAATAYILQATLGAASPVLSTFIEVAFYGPYLVTIAWEDFLNLAASAVSGVPVIGPFISDSILAYAGELEAPGSTPDDPLYYTAGLSGILQYWINTFTGGTIPPPQTAAAVAAPLAARAAAAVTEAVTAPAADAATPAVEAMEVAPVEAGTVTETEGSASVDTPAADAPESAPVEVAAPTAADVKADAEPAESPSSAAADATSEEGSAAASAPSKATSKRPVRDAIAKVNTAVTSAVDSVKAGAASAAAAADAG